MNILASFHGELYLSKNQTTGYKQQFIRMQIKQDLVRTIIGIIYNTIVVSRYLMCGNISTK